MYQPATSQKFSKFTSSTVHKQLSKALIQQVFVFGSTTCCTLEVTSEAGFCIPGSTGKAKEICFSFCVSSSILCFEA